MPSADKYQRARITWRKDYARDLWSVRIAPEKQVAFEAGQYVTLALDRGDGKMIERPYSVASSPLEKELEFFLEMVPQGALTPMLHALKEGDELWMRHRAKGAFTLDRKSGKTKHFYVSTVTGVAPAISMVRTLISRSHKGDSPALQLVVIEAASRSYELGYEDELRAAERESGGWLRYIPSVSRPWEDPGWKGELGRAEDIVRKYLDQFGMTPQDTVAYLCGNPAMIDNAKGILLRTGFDREAIHVEIYWIPKKGGGAASPPSDGQGGGPPAGQGSAAGERQVPSR